MASMLSRQRGPNKKAIWRFFKFTCLNLSFANKIANYPRCSIIPVYVSYSNIYEQVVPYLLKFITQHHTSLKTFRIVFSDRIIIWLSVWTKFIILNLMTHFLVQACIWIQPIPSQCNCIFLTIINSVSWFSL